LPGLWIGRVGFDHEQSLGLVACLAPLTENGEVKNNPTSPPAYADRGFC
jgi:hypothetical protein